jgi:hypothetical protein
MLTLSVCAATACVSAGCGRQGPPLGTVHGQVTMDNQPVPRASITFSPQEPGPSSYGVTDGDGRYTLFFSDRQAGAVLGKHNVQIEALEPDEDENGNPVGPEPVKIPQKYRVPGPLTGEVNAGDNEINFPLDSKEDPSQRPLVESGC